MRSKQRLYRPLALLCLGAAILWGGAGCGSGDTERVTGPEDTRGLPPQVRSARDARTPVSEAQVTANNRFGLEALHELRKADAAKNIVLSPLSLALALQIVYNGARNDTQAAMAKTLHLQEVPLSELNARNAALQASLSQQEPTTTLTIANGLWMRGGAVNPAFVQTNTDYYGSKLGDMKNVPGEVNTWVSEQTKGKIPGLLAPEGDYSHTLLVVVNAIYFKGAWTAPFDPKRTQETPFATPSGPKSVKMMWQETKLPYLRGEGFEGVRLPFGKQKQLSFVVLVPNRDSSLSALLTQVTSEKWAAWREQFRPTRIIVGLPRLKTAYSADMIPSLKALGMEIAFDDSRADFLNLINRSVILDNPYIQFVIHKSTLELTEEGAEASAATAVGVGATSAPPSLVVDRPFLCAIQDEKTGTLLFLGAIVDPTKE
jgi:serine protease inhibitor